MKLPLTFAIALGALGGGIAFRAAELGLPALGILLLASLALRRMELVAGCMAGLWLLISLLEVAAGRLPEGLVSEPLLVEGRVEEVLGSSQRGSSQRGLPDLQRMTLDVEDCRPLQEGLRDCRRLSRLRVSWYSAKDVAEVREGERWQFVVRVRPVSGMANVPGFDYERWLWRRGIQATGSVVASENAVRLARAPVDVRGALLDYLLQLSLDDQARRWLAALTLGAGEQLSDDDWALLRATGTAHLAVVSGLHVGMVAVLMLGAARLLARLLYPRSWRLQVWPWWLAALMISSYVWLVGAEPPALRALIMCLVGLWVASGWHSPSPWQGLALAFDVVVILDPLALWQPGLWLSFAAVMLLVVIWHGRQPGMGVVGAILGLVRTQWLLTPLVAGLVLMAFGQVAWLAPLVNLLAVPWLTLVIVPLGMLGWLASVVIPSVGLVVWQITGYAIEALLWLLTVFADMASVWYPQFPLDQWLALLLLSMAVVLAMPGLMWRLRLMLLLVLLVAGLLIRSSMPADDEVELIVWDVGQGLMVEVRTSRHRLLFDSGPRFRSGFVPLSTFWPSAQHFDAVVISHADLDHAGGVSRLVDDHRVDRWYRPGTEPLELPPWVLVSDCHRGLEWQWDGIDFRFLWPPTDADQWKLSSNDGSCVLEVKVAGRRIVIPGDAGKRTERFWMGEIDGALDVLVAGHHGSATSTGAAMIEAKPPALTIISAGRYNVVGHPADAVIRRLRQAGSCLLSTALDGQVRLRVDASGAIKWHTRRNQPTGGAVEGSCHGVESGH
ncbi:DNA internalization-related competence protein ComEC/Rec2 [Halomonas huangheensis]|uniref:Metallo-beta-lactamase domain-containing protein n=1 Tax=Halomonas huangheensis TaxID=1178482 RepID=W1N6D8_9GAMM|nr:DNA internalization-related competence protein ComEC/Rec2 [Halomonas huangheensis]ALM52159.1 hypothetical protein AR456_07575 [Halomonas huangheensis]ERL50726.1 hypothetical protein BJB45_06220 [Halomonas huangheensis]